MHVPLILMHIRREFKQLVPATDLGIFLLPLVHRNWMEID